MCYTCHGNTAVMCSVWCVLYPVCCVWRMMICVRFRLCRLMRDACEVVWYAGYTMCGECRVLGGVWYV